jgi:hypothetical protein
VDRRWGPGRHVSPSGDRGWPARPRLVCPSVRGRPDGRLATWARALRELIGTALRAPAEALYLLGSCLDDPPSGSKATRTTGARPGTGRTERNRRHPSYPAACDCPGHSPRVAARSARPLPLAREQPDTHLLIVHLRQPPVKGLASLRSCDLLIRRFPAWASGSRSGQSVTWGCFSRLSLQVRRTRGLFIGAAPSLAPTALPHW